MSQGGKNINSRHLRTTAEENNRTKNEKNEASIIRKSNIL
jgi:hypothetical protein